ncbi:MAG: hypothetical protein LBH40_00685 [Alphaproteobacteria bacterium]|nr:hypothetical protein [Alphaproteobacteria bacterium]
MFVCSSTLSVVITNNMIKSIIEQLLGKKVDTDENLINVLNELCKIGLEKSIVCLLKNKQKEYCIEMVNNRPEVSKYLHFWLAKIYL